MNIKTFMNAYKTNVASISTVAMYKYMEFDEELLGANICLLVTDNMIELLGIEVIDKILTLNCSLVEQFLLDHLLDKEMMIVY